ncbi:hypothetical protein CMV_008048 [Castanea mollissima]|uniref:Uncharacterized protein n=1 Tax=Castanea mollissima TaxID=60419 RepID=A0A8J4R810_9ROSI|nr:hypothetical protein CMV_008048 [Castanea mollissima]
MFGAYIRPKDPIGQLRKLGFKLKSFLNHLSFYAQSTTIPKQDGSSIEEGSNDEESAEISKWESVIWLFIMTKWITILSEYLVHAIEGTSIAWKMPLAFIGFAPNCGGCRRACKCYYVYHERQARHFIRGGNRIINADIYVWDSFFCSCRLDDGATYGLRLSAFRDSHAFHNSLSRTLHATGASIAWNVPLKFVSVVLLPIVGNSTMHASAIMFAVKDKLLPISVLVGWILGQPMDLNFQLFETAMLFMTVLVVAFMLQE